MKRKLNNKTKKKNLKTKTKKQQDLKTGKLSNSKTYARNQEREQGWTLIVRDREEDPQVRQKTTDRESADAPKRGKW